MAAEQDPSEAYARSHRWSRAAALGYLLLVVYGSLYPFSGWRVPSDWHAILQAALRPHASLGDAATNLIAYVPLALLATLALGARIASIAIAVATGAALSAAIEVAQAFVPARDPSFVDWCLNSFGALAGALLGWIARGDGRLPHIAAQIRRRWLPPGPRATAGAIALAAWTLSQLVPFVPSLDVGKLRAALAPLAAFADDPAGFNLWLALACGLMASGLALVLRLLLQPWRATRRNAALFFVALLLLQIVIVRRQLTPEVVLGYASGLIIAASLWRMPPTACANLAFVLVFSAFCIDQATAAAGPATERFGFAVFARALDNPISGIGNILANIGVAGVLAWCLRTSCADRPPTLVAWTGGLLVTLAALALEYAQRNIPGRSADITTPLVMGLTWMIAWTASGPGPAHEPAAAPVPRPPAAAMTDAQATARVPAPPMLGDAALVAMLALALWLAARSSAVPYNVRELLWPGHPVRSALLLSVSLYLTLAAPAWCGVLLIRRAAAIVALPLLLIAAASFVYLLLVNAVASESIHDLVGAPVLGWGGHAETLIRFVALHAATGLLAVGAWLAVHAVVRRRAAATLAGWAIVTMLFAPLLYWGIVTQAATDNLTELIRDHASAFGTTILALAIATTFASGSLLAAACAARRGRPLALAAACVALAVAYGLYALGTAPLIEKYGQRFSALQFLLSADRAHYVSGAQLLLRFALVHLALTVAIAAAQTSAWRALRPQPLRTGA